MPVPNSMADLSTLASSNFPTGTESIGNNLDNYIRSISAILRTTYGVASATIASASTVDLGSADAEYVVVTGTNTINSFGTGFAGCKRQVRFNGALTVVNSSNILLPYGANLSVSGSDIFEFRCISPGVWALCSGWRDSGAVRVSGDTMTGGLSIVSQGAGVTLGFRDAANTVLRYFVSCDNSSWAFNNMSDGGGYSGTPMRIYRNNSGVDFGGLVKSLGSASGFNTVDRTSGREWTMYGTGDSWHLDASGLGDRFAVDSLGNATATGNLISNSDENLKRSWVDIPANLVDDLANVRAGEYERIDTGVRQIGVGARSLESVLPLAVSTDAEGLKSVAYGNAALVGVVALARRVLALESAVEVKNGIAH